MSAINPTNPQCPTLITEEGLTKEERAEVIELGKTLGIEDPFHVSARKIKDIREEYSSNQDIFCAAGRLEYLLRKEEGFAYFPDQQAAPCTIQ